MSIFYFCLFLLLLLFLFCVFCFIIIIISTFFFFFLNGRQCFSLPVFVHGTLSLFSSSFPSFVSQAIVNFFGLIFNAISYLLPSSDSFAYFNFFFFPSAFIEFSSVSTIILYLLSLLSRCTHQLFLAIFSSLSFSSRMWRRCSQSFPLPSTFFTLLSAFLSSFFFSFSSSLKEIFAKSLNLHLLTFLFDIKNLRFFSPQRHVFCFLSDRCAMLASSSFVCVYFPLTFN